MQIKLHFWLLAATFFFAKIPTGQAQDYKIEGRKRLNFAQTYFEAGTQFYPAFDAFRHNPAAAGGFEKINNPASGIANLQIGGIHFWGHADFYISIPLAQFRLGEKPSFVLNESVVTGARFMPFAYRFGRLTPYLGTGWTVRNFQQTAVTDLQMPTFTENKLRFDAGLIFGKPKFLLRLGVSAQPGGSVRYPVTKTNFEDIRLPGISPCFGVAYTFESTRSKGMEDVNKKLNEYPALSSPNLKNSPKSGWFLGVGASTTWVLTASGRNETKYPFLNKKSISNTFPDFATGYHFSKIGVATVFSFRKMRFSQSGYGVSQALERRSLVLEMYKFVFDYHGFTPYLGMALGRENYRFEEKSETGDLRLDASRWSQGIVFGWDILPGKTRQRWVLRTNLRWFPFEKINIEKQKLNLGQLEYNVIQLVWYPGR